MPGFLLLIPFLLIRFGLLAGLNKEAIRRAAHFPPLKSKERITYWIYQISTVAILASFFFLKMKAAHSALFYTGLIVFSMGAVLLILSVIHFAAPSESGINKNGIYRLSRNPMYVAYLIYFIGCSLLTQSLILSVFVLTFQIAAHWIIIAEERWCVEKFGREYIEYMESVRRYI